MTLNTQYLLAGVMVIGLIIAGAIIVSGGKIDIPGLSGWRAELTIVADYTWEMRKMVEIKEVTTYKGIGFDVLWPLWFGEDWRLEVTSYRGAQRIDRVVKGIHVEWASAVTTTINVGIGDSPTGVTIKVRLLYPDGTLIDEKSVTI